MPLINTGQTNTNELIIYYRKWNESRWFRVDGTINKGTEPQGEDPPDSILYTFSATFTDPIDYNGNPFEMINGDDIAVVETTDRQAIADNDKCGVIVKTTMTPKGRKNGRWIREFKLEIENRDFSKIPFRLNTQSFANQSITQDLTDVLDFIFTVDNTRDDLGGILSNGIVIPKYALLSPSIDVQISELWDGARGITNDILKPINYKWRPVYYMEPDTVNAINTIQQVEIWQNV